MELYVWDWNRIAVFSGGWWLFLIAIGFLLLGALFGYWAGYRNAKYRYERFPDDHLKGSVIWNESDE